MEDVFLSYAREDKDIAGQIVEAIRGLGVTVWWDSAVGPEPFGAVIEKQLNEARCVVVLWSPHSVGSRWVNAEAGVGADRGVLVPVSIGGVGPPFGLRNYNAIDITEWTPGSDHGGMETVLRHIARRVSQPASAEPGSSDLFVGRYDVQELLGEGGMAHVYAAVDIKLKRRVAIKLIKPELSTDSTFVQRFRQEAKIAMKLSHPCSVTALDFGQADSGEMYLVMEQHRNRRDPRDLQVHGARDDRRPTGGLAVRSLLTRRRALRVSARHPAVHRNAIADRRAAPYATAPASTGQRTSQARPACVGPTIEERRRPTEERV